MQDSRIRVALCICTYRRLAGLRALLSAVARLRFERVPPPDLRIYVVENDQREYARGICDEYRSRLPWPLQYDLEPLPGVSSARNRCLELAAPQADVIAFLDDDERPLPHWLDAILITQSAHAADVVAGPVTAVYDQPPPEWAANSRYHTRLTMPTGTPIDSCGAGNVLFSARLVTTLQVRFHEAMGLCGGEDVLFFTAARRAGAKLVWCDEAVVEETVPVERTRLRWLIRRAYRIGIAKHRAARLLDGRRSAVGQSLWFGATRIGVGIVSLPIAAAGGSNVAVTALCRLAFGMGCLVGVGGGDFNAYRRS